MEPAVYLTPADLIDRPGAQEIARVATPQESAVVDTALMTATLAGDDRSGFDPDEVAVADAALARVQSAIAEAVAMVDAELSKRYALPLPSVPLVLTRLTRSVTRYLLHTHLLTASDNDPVIRDYEAALRTLREIGRGVIELGLAITPPTAESGVLIRSPAGSGRLRAGAVLYDEGA